jgi:hypothetical protein
MCETGVDYKSGLYSSWESRIEHLEKSRYLLLGGEIAILTYVLNYVVLSDASRPDTPGLLLLHLSAAAFAIVIAQLIANLSRGANTAAIELMLLEYRMGVVDQGLGYYAHRAGRPRHAFRILPVAGDLLAVIFIAASWWYQRLTLIYPQQTNLLFLMLLTVALFFGIRNYQRAESLLARKDRLDRYCQQEIERTDGVERFVSLYARKWPNG